MYEQVAAAAGVAGVLLAPVVLWAARVAPTVGRGNDDEDTTGDLIGKPAADRSADVAITAPHSSASVPTTGSTLVGLDGHRRLLAVAVVTGVVLAVLGGRLGADAALPAYLVFGVVAVVLTMVDLEHHRLPDVLTLPSYPVGVALLVVASVAGSDSGSLTRALLGAVVALVLFTAMYLAMPSGIGAGDVKYAGVVGLHAAWAGWGSLVVALVGGFVIGAAVSLVLLAVGRADRRTRVPFGPSMVAGAVLAIGWGEEIAAAWRGG